jgi:pimeloyl-ACP methyl ester carboxylesterase
MVDTVHVRVTPEVALHARLRRAGSNTPLLFVHGLASNSRLWDGVMAAVAAAGHDSVAVDQRGHGWSSQVAHGFDFATLAADLEAVVAATFDCPVIAVGQSWGANVVLEMAARYPERVVGLVLVDGGFVRLTEAFPSWDDARAALTPPSFDHLTIAQVEAMMRTDLGGFSDEAVAAQMVNLEERADGTVRARLQRSNHMAILRRLWDHDPDAVARELRIPIAVIAVDRGDPSHADRVEAFAADGNAIEVHWVDGHHDIHAQQPEVVADILIDLARQVGP